ncbi:MAG: InlB B-repeat-containing protein, partial [Bacillales bacterium]|nr:InlB B-repeat-containing protein [Bacillales bacterium]
MKKKYLGLLMLLGLLISGCRGRKDSDSDVSSSRLESDSSSSISSSSESSSSSSSSVILKWTVTFDFNGGSGSPLSSQVIDGELCPIPEIPSKEHYTFVYWLLGETEYNFNTPVTSNITLEALWSLKQWTVTFDYNGGVGSNETVVVTDGQTVPLPNEPIRPHYTFKFWSLNSLEFDFNTLIVSDLTLLAEWNEIIWTVTFDYNGGSGEIDFLEVRDGETINVPPFPSKPHNNFVKWTLNSLEFDFITPITSNITLVAEWSEIKWTITFDYNGGSGSPLSLEVVDGQTVSLPSEPTRPHYAFVFWTLNDLEYNFSAPVYSDLTLVAKWEEIRWTVTFDYNGGSGSPASYELTDGDLCPVPTNPERHHYEFLYWSLNEIEFDFETPITNNITLVAEWNYSPDGAIATAEEFYNFLYAEDELGEHVANKSKYWLANDIDFSSLDFAWIIKDSNKHFLSAEFDGKGHTISNLSTSNGVFGTIRGGDIHDVILDNISITSTDTAGILGSEILAGNLVELNNIVVKNSTINSSSINGTGGLFGYVNSNLTIDNVIIENTIITSSDKATGGLIGLVDGSTTNLNITNVFVEVVVNSTNENVGGLFGETKNNSKITMDHFSAVLNVSGLDYVGGLIGKNTSSTADQFVKIRYGVVISNVFVNTAHTNAGFVSGGNSITTNNLFFVGANRNVGSSFA